MNTKRADAAAASARLLWRFDVKRLLVWSLWLFFLPAILLWRGMVLFTYWLVAHLSPGPAWPVPGAPPSKGHSRLPRGRLPRVP